MAELVQVFVGEVPSRLAALRDAVERGDSSAAQRIAHALNGSCDHIGGARMAAPCADMQYVGAWGGLTRARKLVGMGDAEFRRVRPALEEEAARG